MAEELVLYTNPQSRGAMSHWMLEEVGCPYRIEVLGFGPAMKTPEYLALNPMGKVPTLKHGDTVVTETGAILCHLADAFLGIRVERRAAEDDAVVLDDGEVADLALDEGPVALDERAVLLERTDQREYAADVVGACLAQRLERLLDEHRSHAVVLEELEQHAAVQPQRNDVRARHAALAGAQRVP